MSFPGGSDGKASGCNVGDSGSIPGSGRSPREENGDPLQYSLLENSMHRGAWWATVHGVTKLDTPGHSHAKKMNINREFIPFTRINTKWIIDLNVK